MINETINSVLLALHTQIIHNGLDGLDHVHALLVKRGIDPAARIVRAKRRPDAARRGVMRVVVLDAMRDGPKCFAEIVALVAAKRPEITPEAPYKRGGTSNSEVEGVRGCGTRW